MDKIRIVITHLTSTILWADSPDDKRLVTLFTFPRKKALASWAIEADVCSAFEMPDSCAACVDS